jgi:hypothetical protein
MIEIQDQKINSDFVKLDLMTKYDITNYEVKLNGFYKGYTSLFSQIEISHLKCVDVVSDKIYQATKLNVLAMDKIASFSKSIIDLNCKVIDALNLEWFARHTLPFSPIWYYVRRRMENSYDNLFFVPGVHYLVALPGGGKSSIIYDLTEELRYRTGKSAYINVEMEIPKLDVNRQIFTVNRRYFEVDEFFGLEWNESKNKFIASQLKQFDTEHFCAIVFDEWLSNFNHRQNKTNDYNQSVIPIISFFAKKRQQGMPYVYIASQIDTTDNQIMSFFTYIHEIEIVRDIPLQKWIRDGLWEKDIIGWHVWTYGFKRTKNGIEKVLVRKWFKERFTPDFSYFNTFNAASSFRNIPKDSNFIRKVGN